MPLPPRSFVPCLFLALAAAAACEEDESTETPAADESVPPEEGSAPPPSAMGEVAGDFRNVGLQLFGPDADEGPGARLLFDRAPGHSTAGEVAVHYLPDGEEDRKVEGVARFNAESGMYETSRVEPGALGRFASLDVELEGTLEDEERTRERFRFAIEGAGRDDPESPVYLGDRVED